MGLNLLLRPAALLVSTWRESKKFENYNGWAAAKQHKSVKPSKFKVGLCLHLLQETGVMNFMKRYTLNSRKYDSQVLEITTVKGK